MKQKIPADMEARVRCAVEIALRDPSPNPWAAALWALWAGRHKPSDAEIQAAWGLLAEKLTAARRGALEEKISQTENASKKKRRRAELRQDILPPQYPLPVAAPDDASAPRRQLLESYTVDTDWKFFRRAHETYRKAQREGTPVRYIVSRRGEPDTIEFHAPASLPPTPRRPSAGGAPKKLTPVKLRADMNKHPGSNQVDRARRLGVSVRTLRNVQGKVD